MGCPDDPTQMMCNLFAAIAPIIATNFSLIRYLWTEYRVRVQYISKAKHMIYEYDSSVTGGFVSLEGAR